MIKYISQHYYETLYTTELPWNNYEHEYLQRKLLGHLRPIPSSLCTAIGPYTYIHFLTLVLPLLVLLLRLSQTLPPVAHVLAHLLPQRVILELGRENLGRGGLGSEIHAYDDLGNENHAYGGLGNAYLGHGGLGNEYYQLAGGG